MSFKKGTDRLLFNGIQINATMVRLAKAALVNNVFINVQANMAVLAS